MRSDTEPWWKQAQADLAAADYNLQGGHYYLASWCAQQAAEKAMKALHVERYSRLAPRTHDLSFLGTLLQVPAGIQADLDGLTPAFDVTRYPTAGTAPVDAIGQGVAAADVEAARRILGWVGNQL